MIKVGFQQIAILNIFEINIYKCPPGKGIFSTYNYFIDFKSEAKFHLVHYFIWTPFKKIKL